MLRRLLACLAALLALAPPTASAQTSPAEPVVSIVTFGPGPIVFERFGHIAIRIQIPSRGVDVCYDWGNFDFDEPGFLWRFVRGDMRYWMQGKYTQRMLPLYLDADRTVIEQRLNLDAAQTRRLLDALGAQDTDENRFYRYDYYADNCSTRVRDAIDLAVSGQLKAQSQASTPHTYRWHTRRAMSVGIDNRTLAPFMDFAAGSPVDPPLSQWEEAFLPLEFSRQLDAVTIDDGNGGRAPLVAERRVLNETTTPGNVDAPTPGRPVIPATVAGVVGAGLMLGVGRVWRTGGIAIALFWEGFAAFGFTFITALWTLTKHWPIASNWNVLHFSPLAFVLIVALIFGRSRRRLRWAAPAALGLSLLAAVITGTGLSIQEAWPAIGLAVPMHAAVCLMLRDRPARAAAEGVPS